jgi:hypothetical protein
VLSGCPFLDVDVKDVETPLMPLALFFFGGQANGLCGDARLRMHSCMQRFH